MGIIHTAKRYILDELYSKLQERNVFLNGRESTELENTKVSLLFFIFCFC